MSDTIDATSTMQRLYHSSPLVDFVIKQKKLILLGLLLSIFLVYISPLLPYFIKTLHLTKEFIVPSEKVRSTDGRTNVLILGLDGRDNKPSGLTDTILFTSFNPGQKKALILSLPRDLWIPDMQAKINTAYFYGNEQEGVGIDWSKKYVEQVVGQPVHYTVVISFEGFTKIIDLLGGVDVDVERSFVDERYPIPGLENDLCEGDLHYKCRYETLNFEKGLQHMDGETALKFARSRHAEGEEGTDFARGERQQKIIFSVREKIFSGDVLLNPSRASQVLQAIEGLIETNIPESQYGSLAKFMLSSRDVQIKSQVLDYVFDKPSLLINPPLVEEYQKQFVLLPKDSSWNEIHLWVNCLLTQEDCSVEKFTNSF